MSKTKGSIPEFGGFAEGNAGFTGMFEVKKQARRAQQDELDFPEPVETGNYDKKEEKKKEPKKKKGQQAQQSKPQGGCCTIM